MVGKRLKPNRAGLLNFWYYDLQEFHFADGKLLLRGSNGSGKSVTMQSLLPALLDGRTSSDRLDPFGSRARRMDDYLLGEVSNRDERTGYLWMEFKRQDSERFITCGIGLRARRNAALEFWGFVITDNRRIGRDLELYKTELSVETGKEELVPLSRRELANRLQAGGRVVETRTEYMDLVNKHVFGFAGRDAYDELIKLLIQLRSPKLSKDFKPTVIYEILNAALPPLADEELRPLSETIENMDQIKQQLEQLQRDEQAMKRLAAAYDNYNRWQLWTLAKSLLQADEHCGALQQGHSDLQHSMQKWQSERQAVEQEYHELQVEQRSLKSELQHLEEHEVYTVEKKYHQLETAQKSRLLDQQKKQAQLSEKQQKELKAKEALRQEAERANKLAVELDDVAEQLEELAVTAVLALHVEQHRHWLQKREQGDYDFSFWDVVALQHMARLEAALQAILEHNQAQGQHREADADHAIATRALDDKEREQAKMQDEMRERKEGYLIALDAWAKQLTELDLTPAHRLAVAQRVDGIYDDHSPSLVLQPVEQALKTYNDQSSLRKGEIKSRLKHKDEEIAELREEIRKWREQAEPEPARHSATETARQELRAAGVPYAPFYAAVEFREGVSDHKKERIEAAITEAGLLDALIVPEGSSRAVSGHDKVIIPAPQMFAYTLADVLQPVPTNSLDGEAIDNVLRSILYDVPANDGGSMVLGSDGRYRIALLSGHAPTGQGARFIGREARRRYRERELQRLADQLDVLKTERAQIVLEQNEVEQRYQVAQQEYGALPSLQGIEEQWLRLSTVEAQLSVCQNEVTRKNQKLAACQKRLLEARNRQHLALLELNIEASESSARSTLGTMKEYTSALSKLQLTYQKWGEARRLVVHHGTTLQEVQADVDNLKGELAVLLAVVQQAQREMGVIERQLLEMGAEDVKKRSRWVNKRLDEIPQALENAVRETTKLQSDLLRGNEGLAESTRRLAVAQRVREAWQQLFLSEAALGYVSVPEGLGPLQCALQVKKQVGQALQQTDGSRVLSRLNEAYYRELALLTEYRPTLTEHPRELTFAEFAESFSGHTTRWSLVLEYQGRRTDVVHVLESLQRDAATQQELLNAKDRELYEEIILHSVGDMIRRRINRAEEWVNKISKLMEERDTSSGLTFSLVWKPRTAEHENELDTRELVELLRLDPALLKTTDSDRIATHFRVQINRAKAEMSERKQGETFQTIVRELLDYRRWFDFKLFFRKEGAIRRELTDRVFFTFSGGEKAMAMYIPLFSAAYSRYQEARDDAPRLISLDEAFAGVDETNIRDMFGLMEQLGFDYVINSQALWGDYDTTGRLAISELVRPKNAPYVTVVPYLWDGSVRRMLSPEGGESIV